MSQEVCSPPAYKFIISYICPALGFNNTNIVMDFETNKTIINVFECLEVGGWGEYYNPACSLEFKCKTNTAILVLFIGI